MRALAASVGRERELVAARIARLLHGVGHHLAANATALLVLRHHHVFDDGRGRAPVRQVVHDEQRIGAHHRILVGGIAWQAHVGGFIVGGVFTWLLISGVHALRGKSLTFRTMVYGAVVLALIVAGVLVCNLSNPALTYIM